jgi:hypothetical protein
MFQLQNSASLETLGMTRRAYIQAGLLGLGGLGLGDLLRLQAQAGTTTKKKENPAVILLFAHGGPSHLETYDMKPDAPTEIRGPYRPIRTNVPGIELCEHLPLHAKIADKFTLIRSCCHDEADHFAGHRRFLSGYGKLKPGFGYESNSPMVGAVVTRVMQGKSNGLPPALSLNGVLVNGPDYAAGISEGYWPGMYRVPIVNGGLRDSSLNVDPRRLDDRYALLKQFDQFRRDVDLQRSMETADAFQQQAIDILTAGKVQAAFDVSKEDPAVRAKFGEGFGREALIARRLVEAGVSFVSLCSRGGGPGSNAHNWDDHAVNWDMNTAMLARFPEYDHVVTTLIEDIFERGLHERVLLIVTGEFGRTPRLEYKDGKIGRDHWPGAMSILVSGGGMPMGQVIGKTDKFGGHPTERSLDPHDFLATIYHYLGIDPHQYIEDASGRPVALCEGQPIAELF